jgi:phosphatidylinositol alpha-1,6-mannosyltransferase
MNIALIFYGNPPEQGGVGQVLECLIKSFRNRNDKIFFFNPYYKDENTITIFKKKKYPISKLISTIFRKTAIKLFLLSLWKIFHDGELNRTDKLKILLYLILKPNVLANALKNLEYICKYIEKLDIDVFLGGTATADVLSLIFLLSRIFNKKVTTLTYGNEFLVHSRYSLRTVYFKNLDMLILGTNALKNLIKQVHHLPENKLEVINYGLIPKDYDVHGSKEELRKELGIPLNEFVLLSVGRHVSRKKFDLVIWAVKKIKEKIPSINISYILIGEGEETPKLKKLAAELQIENQIQFLGFTNILTRNMFYKVSDVFLMPSIVESESIEGFGIVFLEANYFKLPVIGTYSGGIVEAIIDGKTGFLVKQNDLDDLVEKILVLYENKYKRETIGIEGYKRVIKYFNWDKLIEDYIQLFKRLLKEN